MESRAFFLNSFSNLLCSLSISSSSLFWYFSTPSKHSVITNLLLSRSGGGVTEGIALAATLAARLSSFLFCFSSLFLLLSSLRILFSSFLLFFAAFRLASVLVVGEAVAPSSSPSLSIFIPRFPAWPLPWSSSEAFETKRAGSSGFAPCFIASKVEALASNPSGCLTATCFFSREKELSRGGETDFFRPRFSTTPLRLNWRLSSLLFSALLLKSFLSLLKLVGI